MIAAKLYAERSYIALLLVFTTRTLTSVLEH